MLSDLMGIKNNLVIVIQRNNRHFFSTVFRKFVQLIPNRIFQTFDLHHSIETAFLL